MFIPDKLPVLTNGKQPPGTGKVCAEQFVDWLVSGMTELGDHTDRPSCVQPVLNSASIIINDFLDDDDRPKLAPMLLRQPGTAFPGVEPQLSINLAKWSLAYIEDRRPTHENHTFGKIPRVTAFVDRAINIAKRHKAIDPYEATANAQCAVDEAVRFLCYPDSRDLLPFLSALQDEHARLTGFTPSPVDPERYALGVSLVGEYRG